MKRSEKRHKEKKRIRKKKEKCMELIVRALVFFNKRFNARSH